MMINPTTPPPIPKPRRRRWLWTIPLVILTPVIAAVVWYVSARVSNSTAVRKLEAKVRQRGEPLTLEELATKYAPVPDDQNAAFLILRAWRKEDPEFWLAFINRESSLPRAVPQTQTFDPALPFLGNKTRRVPRQQVLSPESRAAAESFLRDRAEHMQEIRTALQRSSSRFPLQFTNGMYAHLPHLAKMKTEAQSFAIEALVATERGEPAVAIEALHNIIRTADALADEPYLISQLVRVACHSIALNEAERLLSRESVPTADLQKLQSIFSAPHLTNAYAQALIGERAMIHSVIDGHGPGFLDDRDLEKVDSGQPDDRQRNRSVGTKFLKTVGLADADKRILLETMEQAIDLAEQATPQAMQEHAALETEALRKARSFPPKIFTSLFLPAINKSALKFASAAARQRAALTAIAIERYRQDNQSKLPDQLDQLVPRYLEAVPSDPYDGQPLKYRTMPTGYTVYSIGPDRTDDDGQERTTKGRPKDFDETFIVER